MRRARAAAAGGSSKKATAVQGLTAHQSSQSLPPRPGWQTHWWMLVLPVWRVVAPELQLEHGWRPWKGGSRERLPP